jgi:CspA family cold shock protein
MTVGKVVKFDQVRGFGFIAPAGGGEDVFLHVNDLLMLESEVRPGITVEFDVDEGDRGLKGSNIRLAEGAAGEVPQLRPLPGPPAPGSPLSGSFTSAPTATTPVAPDSGAAPAALFAAPGAAAASAAIAAVDATASAAASPIDNELCDVLTPGEFTAQITELLLAGVPTITGTQVLEARRQLLAFAKARGWVTP